MPRAKQGAGKSAAGKPANRRRPRTVGASAAAKPDAEARSVVDALHLPVSPAPAPVPAAVTAGDDVMLGNIVATMRRMSPVDVLDCLGEIALDRIEALKSNPSILQRAARMRSSEGRCPPVYFTTDGNEAAIFDGFDALAMALVSGIPSVDVIFAPADRASELQTYLVAKLATPDKDDLMLRLIAEDDE